MDLLYQRWLHSSVRRWGHAECRLPRLGLRNHLVPDEEEVLELFFT